MRLLLVLSSLLLCAAGSWATHPIYYQVPVYAQPVQQKVYIAQSVLVPVLVPSALLVNLAPIVAPPPVTVAPQALLEAQGTNAAMLSRMEALERKLDLLLNQPMAKVEAIQDRPSLQQVAGVLKQHCMQCHAGANARAEVRLFNDQGAYDPNLPMAAIIAAIRTNRMPKGPNKIPPEQKNLLEAWLKP